MGTTLGVELINQIINVSAAAIMRENILDLLGYVLGAWFEGSQLLLVNDSVLVLVDDSEE